MKVEDVYIGVKMRVESNVTNGGIALDRARFVSLFNDSMYKFVDDVLKKKNDDTIRDIDILLRHDVRLALRGSQLNKALFRLPADLYSFVNVRCSASSGKCTVNDFLLTEAKPENVHELLADTNSRPSFEYRETFYTVGGGSVVAYTSDFNINNLYLTYYRKPKTIDISGIVRDDGASVSVDPEFDDHIVVRIMDICVKEYNLNESNLNRYSIDKQEVYSTK
jgi:hypothetical protein